jgi:hypothetical protein
VKLWCVLVLGRGVSEDFLVTRWRRSNRPPIPGLTAPLWLAGFRGVSAVVGVCVLRLLVEIVPRISSTPVTTCFGKRKVEVRSV